MRESDRTNMTEVGESLCVMGETEFVELCQKWERVCLKDKKE